MNQGCYKTGKSGEGQLKTGRSGKSGKMAAVRRPIIPYFDPNVLKTVLKM